MEGAATSPAQRAALNRPLGGNGIPKWGQLVHVVHLGSGEFSPVRSFLGFVDRIHFFFDGKNFLVDFDMSKRNIMKHPNPMSVSQNFERHH